MEPGKTYYRVVRNDQGKVIPEQAIFIRLATDEDTDYGLCPCKYVMDRIPYHAETLHETAEEAQTEADFLNLPWK